MGREAFDRGLARYYAFCKIAVQLGFMVKNPDRSWDWTEKGDKVKG